MADRPTLLEQFHALYWDMWPYVMLGSGLIVAFASAAEGRGLVAFGGLCISAWGAITLAKQRGREAAWLGITEAIVACCVMIVFLRELFLEWRSLLGFGR